MKLGTRVAHKVLPALLAAAMASVCLPTSSAFAETVTVSDIVNKGKGFTLTVPSVVAVDSNLSEADIRAIFTGDFKNTAKSLATLNAASIVIPEITISYDLDLKAEDGGKKQGSFTYKDIEIIDVVNGVAQSSSIAGGEATGPEDATITIGMMSTGLFNIAGMLGFYGLVAPSQPDTIETIYKDFNFEGAEIKSPEANCDIGSVTVDEFKARPLKTSFVEIMALSEELAKDKPSPEAVKSFVNFYMDFLSAFESSPMEFSGLSCTGTDEKGQPVDVSTGTIMIDGFSPGIYPAISASDINVNVEGDGKVAIGNITSKAIDFTNTIAVLKAETAPLDEAWFEANYRKVIPAYQGFTLSDIDVDVPDEESPGQRIKAKVGEVDLTLGSYVNGIPTQIATSASDVEFTIPKDDTDETFKQLTDLGFEKLNVGYSLGLHWNEAEDTIAVDNLSVTGENLGTVTLAGTIGNATETLFGDDLDAAMMAAMGLTVKDIKIDLENAGFVGIALAKAGEEQGQDAESFKTALSGMVQGGALAILGGTAQAKEVAEALDSFIKGSPLLTIGLAAKDPAGVGLADFMAIESDPTAIAKVMDITAKASGEVPAAPAAAVTGKSKVGG